MPLRFAVLPLFLGGCGTPPEASAPSPEAAPVSAPNPTPHDALAQMDSRTPVPLQPVMAWHQKQQMMGHLEAIQGILAGAAAEDWSAVRAAAAGIASSPQMAQQCEHMGAGAEGFTPLALSFHEAADGIVAAAAAEDGTAVLAATAKTVAICTRCHATYRQDVVDASTWRARTGSAMDGNGPH